MIHNQTEICTDRCKNTLVGLTSTPEGQKLMNCDCDGDLECEVAKINIEACRDSVLHATKNGTIVSCTEARWICSADAECGKALEYYQLYCQSMFRGRKCTQRCKNSWNILQRQEKAEKLVHCECQNDELFDTFECQTIKENMESLCVDQDDINNIVDEDINVETTTTNIFDEDYNEIDVDETIKHSKATGFKNSTKKPISFSICAVILLQLFYNM